MYIYQKDELIPQKKEVEIDKDIGKPKDISVKEVDTTLKVQTANSVNRKQYKINTNSEKKPVRIRGKAVNRTAISVNNSQIAVQKRSENILPKSQMKQNETNDSENDTEKKNIVYINKNCIQVNRKKSSIRRNKNVNIKQKVINKTRDIIDEQAENDSGAAAISSGFKVVRGIQISAEAFRTSQLLSEGMVKGVKTTFKGVKNVASVPERIRTGEIQINVKQKIRNIKTTTRKIVTADIKITKSDLKKLKNRTLDFTKRELILSRDITHKGTIKMADSLADSDDMGLQSLGTGIKTVNITGEIVGKSIDGVKAVPGQIKGVKTQVKKQVNTAVNKTIQTGKIAEHSYQAVKTQIRNVKKDGIKASLKKYGQSWKKSVRYKTKTAVIKAGNSIVSATFSGLRTVAVKVAIPIIIASVFIMFFINLISSVGVATASIFSPFMSNKSGQEINETEWLESKIDNKRAELITEVQKLYDKNLKKNGGEYDYIQISTNISAVSTAVTRENIDSSVYTTEKYIQLIQPIFHVMMLTKYELNADENEMTDVFNDIWDNISNITTEKQEEQFCDEGIKDRDGLVHADLNICPNHTEVKYHDQTTINTMISTCDIPTYVCKGHKDNLLLCGKSEGMTETRTLICKKSEHKHTASCFVSKGAFLIKTCPYNEEHEHSEEAGCYSIVIENHKHIEWKSETEPGCYATKYCTPDKTMNQPCTNCEYTIKCKGYAQCLGHKILKIKVIQNSFEDLLYRYYGKEIEELEARDNLTPDERLYLNDLKDNYDICSEYIKVISEEMGINTNEIISYDDTTLNQITSLACSYVGNPYVYGGTDIENGIDCSAFVQYIYGKFGTNLPRTSKEQVKCGQEVNSIDEAKQGDLIFYADDSNRDGVETDDEVYHVAMYIGDGKIVHASNEAPYPKGGIKISYVGAPYKIKRM